MNYQVCFNRSGLLAFFCAIHLFATDDARAAKLKARCDEDMLDSRQAALRNGWARRCDIIDHDDEAFYNRKGQYVTFVNFTAPVDINAPCPSGDVVFLGAYNVAGCYTPEQRVMFSGVYRPIRDAALEDVETVTSLNDGWSVADKAGNTTEEMIESYVVGDETRDVLTITAENGFSIEVTDKHPLVTDAGVIIKAGRVRAGVTKLLTTDGPRLVRSVTSRPYRGQVWNLEPESTRTLANVVFAEGFLNGSVRYQNEWAEDSTRLVLRDRLNIAAF